MDNEKLKEIESRAFELYRLIEPYYLEFENLDLEDYFGRGRLCEALWAFYSAINRKTDIEKDAFEDDPDIPF